VPEGVTHYLVWSRLPFIHPDIVPVQIRDIVAHDGWWGFTGSDYKPKATGINADLTRTATRDIQAFVLNNWEEQNWETIWFMNPPRTQSVPELAHFHVFARKKETAEPVKNADQGVLSLS